MADDPTDTELDPEAIDGPAESETVDAGTDVDETSEVTEPEAADATSDGDDVEGEAPAAEAGSDAADADGTEAAETGEEPEEAPKTEAKADGGKGADAPKVPVVRRKVVSKRVTPKGGGPARSSGPVTKAQVAEAQARRSKKGGDADEEITFNDRYVSPSANAMLPSPWWVPALMFGLIIVGALVIILNYMEVFGDPSNWRLLAGLGFILGGIITATQYR